MTFIAIISGQMYHSLKNNNECIHYLGTLTKLSADIAFAYTVQTHRSQAPDKY